MYIQYTQGIYQSRKTRYQGVLRRDKPRRPLQCHEVVTTYTYVHLTVDQENPQSSHTAPVPCRDVQIYLTYTIEVTHPVLCDPFTKVDIPNL